MLTWVWGVGLGATLIATTYMVLMGLGYDNIALECRDDNTPACAVQASMQSDMILFLATTALSFGIMKWDLKKWYQSMVDPVAEAKAGNMFAF